MARKTRKLTATTPVGTFTRRTARTYSHVIVACSPAAEEEARRLRYLHSVKFWLEQDKATETQRNIDYYQGELKEALAEQPITQDRYSAVSWVGRPDLLAARLKDTTNGTAYPVDDNPDQILRLAKAEARLAAVAEKAEEARLASLAAIPVAKAEWVAAETAARAAKAAWVAAEEAAVAELEDILQVIPL